MAELVLGSVVDSIVGHAVSLAAQEIRLVCGVKGELKKLEMTASAIAALLREADKRGVDSEDVKDWLQKLKDVVYEADDLLDGYSTEALRHRRVAGRRKQILKEVRAFFSRSNQIVYAYKMANRVMEMRENIDTITDDRVRFQLEGKSNSCPGGLVKNPVARETYPFESQPYVIGRDNDRKEVMEFLLDPDYEENVSILPIVGIGGLGKTTLARLIFNDKKANEIFAPKLWVCVSTNFDVEDILRKILRECSCNEEPAKLNMKQLQSNLEKELGGKRFLLVLDDVWNDIRPKWLELQGFLMNGAKGSKILVTTRSPRVAKTMTKKFHQLKGLHEVESLNLLMRIAMKEEHEWRGQNLETIAKEVVKKCAGVPLAITTIGRLLLFSRNKEEDWSNFKDHDLSRIDQEEGDIMPSLRLSYDYLPPHLKQCFAYCSLFPKDYRLSPSELIRLWIAQGFIIKSPSNKKTLEEVGYDYFMELLSRSFFHCAKEDTYGDIIECEMHDLMHDLAVLVAGDSCISISSTADVKKIPQGVRHICVLVGLEDDEFKGFERDGRIRSLLFAIEVRYGIRIPNLDVSWFRNLRALRLQGVGVEVISNSFGKLKHLRSLDLSLNFSLKSLPDSISCLCNLETLNLRECYHLERLPRGLTKLVNLRHLDMALCNSLTHMPRGIGRLTTLQTLSLFAVREKGKSSGARLNELSRLVGLRKELTIQNLGNLGNILDEVDTSFSIEKIGLQSLNLIWTHDMYRRVDEEVLERLRPHPNLARLSIQLYSGSKISTWASQLHKLAVIEIIRCPRCEHLPPLDHLPLLQRITLIDLPSLEWIELSDSGTLQCSFPSLEELELKNLYKFKGWDQRRRSENGLEQGIQAEEEDSLLMLIPAFSEKIRVSIWECPTFSYLHGQHLHLMQITNKILQEQLRISSSTRSQIPSMMTMTPISSISLAALTGLTIGGMEDVEHLPMNLIQSCSSLESLTIKYCPRLKSLSMRKIRQYLDALEMLKICQCYELDLSIVIDDDDNTDGGEGMDNLQLQGHSKLRHISISNIHKLASLLEFILCFPNLETLEISRVTCWSEDQEDMSRSQFSGSTKLRELAICGIKKMETLPGWIQHLTSLEYLSLEGCSNLKALPEWFPKLTSLKTLRLTCYEELWRRCRRNKGEDWPKISHIESVFMTIAESLFHQD